ncbi:hypothetical protein BC830DRAFT_854704 [Chytriomyces sp. MP71]|nr:hypothetical protein BC830DRAFT_854704 [Chytriomyces sp. MP71]
MPPHPGHWPGHDYSSYYPPPPLGPQPPIVLDNSYYYAQPYQPMPPLIHPYYPPPIVADYQSLTPHNFIPSATPHVTDSTNLWHSVSPNTSASATVLQNITPTSPRYTSESNYNQSPPRNQLAKLHPSCLLYGEMELSALRRALKGLDGMTAGGNEHIDEFLDALIDQSRASDKTGVRRHALRCIRAHASLLTACRILDRPKVIGLMETFLRERYPSHLSHMMSILSEEPANAPESPFLDLYTASSGAIQHPLRTSAPAMLVDAFRRAVTFVPSFRANPAAARAVEDLCEICTAPLASMKGARGVQFARMVGVARQLLGMCRNGADQNMFILALDIGRSQNKDHFDLLLQDLQALYARWRFEVVSHCSQVTRSAKR